MTYRLRAPRILLCGRLALYAAALGFLSACGGSSPTSPSPVVNVPYSQTDIRVGTGAAARSGDRLSVNYTGWLYDPNAAQQRGTMFDSSASRGPFQFTLGTGAVIRGWDQGVAGMQVGGVRRLVLPPDLAYGSTGAGGGVIPPNATLVFEIELLSIQ